MQTNLTWLDLSFNKICKIEGLDTLTKLMDLSLFNNQISTIENLDNLVHLNVLSLGKDDTTCIYDTQHAANAMCGSHDSRLWLLVTTDSVYTPWTLGIPSSVI